MTSFSHPQSAMAPPTYGDLGKSARDVFGKGFHFGLVKLEAKTTSATGVAFTSAFTQNLASAKVLGNLETKYKCKEHGKEVGDASRNF